MYLLSYLPRLHSAPIPGLNPGRWGRSVLRGFSDPRLRSDPTHGADPASGAERTSSSTKFHSHATRGKVPYIAGQTRLSVYQKIYMKKAVSDPACGRTLRIWRSTKGGSDPASGQVICVYIEGQKACLTPHVGFDPTIGALCKCGVRQV